MNHSSFRFWIKNLESNIIYDTFGMNVAKFKAVALIVSLYGDYANGNNIKMSWKTIANEAGVDRKTALKVRDVLTHNKLLIETEVLESNISVYRLGALVDSEYLTCPFWWSENGPNSTSCIDSIKIEESSFHSDSLEINLGKTKEELHKEWMMTDFAAYKENPAAAPEENSW